MLARELVAARPDLIYALGGDVAPFVRGATNTIPIVMAVSNDPVQANLVASLQRPGGNITGVTFVSPDLAAKRLQFLHELAPQLARVAVMWNPDHVDPEYRETQTAGKSLGIQVHSLEVRSRADFESAYQTALSVGAQALIPVSSRLMTSDRAVIIAFADRHRLLLATGWGPWAREGALLSYGPDLDEITRRSAAHVDKILHGVSPAGRATHPVPTRAQRQESQGSRPNHSGKATRAGRRGDRVRRREFILFLGCATAAWPLAVRAQQRAHVVGILAPQPLPPIERFVRKLSEYGYVEGQNCTWCVASRKVMMTASPPWLWS